MKKIILLGLATLFTLCRIFPLQKKKVVLLCRFPQWGSLGVLGDALEADPRGFRVLRIQNWRKLHTIYHLATAGTIFLNDGFRPLAYFPISKQAKVIQLWHADGALKRWGASAGESFPEAKRYTAVVCASEAIVPHWAEAFGISPARVLPLGSPQIDALRANFAQEKIDGQVVLWAPSFRGDNLAFLPEFDFTKLMQTLPNTTLWVRLHPKMQGHYVLPKGVVDVSDKNLSEIFQHCSRLITDVSSIMVDAAALGLPVVIYAKLDEYSNCDRGFYTNLHAQPPGPIAENFDDLLQLLAQPDNSQAARLNFTKHHAGAADGQSCARIIRTLFSDQ